MTRTNTLLSVPLVAALCAFAALVGLSAAAPLSLAAPAAPASAAADLERSDYLRFPRPAGGFLRVENRRIYLASGWYAWQAFDKIWSSSRPYSGTRRIYLRAGWYRWHIRLFDHDVVPCMACAMQRHYMLESRLYELATGGAPAVLKHLLDYHWRDDGTYDWGSTLQRR